MPSLENVFIHNPKLAFRRVGEGVIVVDPGAGEVSQLNESASFVWELCDGEHSLHQIAESMTKVFEVDFDTAARDILSLAGQLVEGRLLESKT